MGNYAIGVDLGGTNLRIAAVDEGGKMLAKTELGSAVSLGREHVIGELCQATEAMQASFNGVAGLCGIFASSAAVSVSGFGMSPFTTIC